MPRVTLWLRPNGLPTASTKSPISSASLSPSCAAARPGTWSIDITATSVSLSLQIRLGMKHAAIGQMDFDPLAASNVESRADW